MTQPYNPPHLAWANASQRGAQPTPVQRQHPAVSQGPSRTSQAQSHSPQPQSQPSHEDLFPSGAQFASRLDDFRNGGRGISGQLGAAGGQPQTGSIDEFPPLGQNAHAELNRDRSGSLLQGTAGFGGYNNGIPFSGVTQPQATPGRTMMAAAINGQDTTRVMSPIAASGGMF